MSVPFVVLGHDLEALLERVCEFQVKFLLESVKICFEFGNELVERRNWFQAEESVHEWKQ